MSEELPQEEQVVAALRQIIRAVDLHSRKLLESCGLTGPQLAVLREVRRLEPVPSGALARAVHLSQPTTTGILRRLEKRGLLTRRPGRADRRTVKVELTSDGRQVLAGSPSLLQDRFSQELGRLDEWERLMTLSVLQRVAAMMGAEDLDAAPHLASGAAIAESEADSRMPDAVGAAPRDETEGRRRRSTAPRPPSAEPPRSGRA